MSSSNEPSVRPSTGRSTFRSEVDDIDAAHRDYVEEGLGRAVACVPLVVSTVGSH